MTRYGLCIYSTILYCFYISFLYNEYSIEISCTKLRSGYPLALSNSVTNSTTTSATSATGALIHILGHDAAPADLSNLQLVFRGFGTPAKSSEIINKSLPTTEIASRRIFVSFRAMQNDTDSPGETESEGIAIIGSNLRLAEAKFKFNGHYIISALAKQNIVGPSVRFWNRRSNWMKKSPAPTIRQ